MGMKKLVRQGHLLIYNGLVSPQCNAVLWRLWKAYKPHQVAAFYDDMRTLFKTLFGLIIIGFVVGNNSSALLFFALLLCLVCYAYVMRKVPEPPQDRTKRSKRRHRGASRTRSASRPKRS
jgi:hypothetical protein